jgi:mediator of RNA polymerase II transcription subunit 5
LAEGSQSTPVEQLTEEQNTHLAQWTKGLFDPDGITEEVMSSCRPQQFYLLVPTLFSQTVFACSTGVLPLDTVKNGLEYLLEPFLLPSLVGAIHWLTAYVWEQTHGDDLEVVLEILKRVTRVPSASAEGQAMHSAIMTIVSRRLSRCLRTLRRRHPKHADLENLITLAESHSKSLRSNFSPSPEFANWVSAPGSLKHAFQMSLQSLITWSTNVTVNPLQHPPPYNHRQLLITVEILGAEAVLQILLDEVKSRTVPGDPTGAVALDITTTIVCAPTTSTGSGLTLDSGPKGGRLSLRDALNLALERAPDIINKDTPLAETIVRLHRRVEAQLSASNVPPMADSAAGAQIPTILPHLNITGDPQSAVDAAVAAAARQSSLDFGSTADAMGLGGNDAMGMDLTGSNGTGLDLLGDGGLGTGDDDIFGGLELDDNMDFGLE